MESNDALIDYLVANGVLYDDQVEQAMRNVDRIAFVPKQYRASAYRDIALPIGFDQTISQPTMVAIMTQHLQVGEGMNVLEIGAGSGYQAAILSELVGAEGEVHTLERISELAARTRSALTVYSNVHVTVGNGSLGLREKAPFDRILVACAARMSPQPLVAQLDEGGRMIIPLGHGAMQMLTLVEKIAGKVEKSDLACPCRFVPLIE